MSSDDRSGRIVKLDASCYLPTTVRELGRIGAAAAGELARDFDDEPIPLFGAPRRIPPEHVLSAARDAMTLTGYPPGRGSPTLTAAISERVHRSTGVAVDPATQVIVTNGAIQGLHVVITALLGPGDEAIIPSPCFSYDGLVRLADGRPVFVPMDVASEYAWDMDRIEAAIGPRTKLLIVNTPVNPSGRVLTRDELAYLTDIAERHGLLILADEAYDRLVYDGREHVSIYSVPGAAERTFLVQSATKSYAMGAWRVGWVVAPQAFTTVFAKMIEWMMLAGSHVAQAAVAAAIDGPQEWLADLGWEFEVNRNLSVELLREIEQLPFVVPQGGPFLLPDASALGVTGDEFARVLITDFGLRVTGGSYYDVPSCIRIPFGGARVSIEESYRRLAIAVAGWPR